MIALAFIFICLFWSGVAFRYSKMHQSLFLRHLNAISSDNLDDNNASDRNDINSLIPPGDRPTGRYIPVTESDDLDLGQDEELEQDMAVELYNLLRGRDEGLTLEKFLDWDDIKEVLERGFLDKESIGIIVSEVGVNSGIMDFKQFQEVVDLVNQLSTTLEAGDFVDSDDEDEDDIDTEEFERLDNEKEGEFGPGSFEIWRERS